jgi:hypothetical protein
MARTGQGAETIWRSKRSKVFGKWYALRTLCGYIAERVKPSKQRSMGLRWGLQIPRSTRQSPLG